VSAATKQNVRCLECDWKGARKTSAGHGERLPKPCPDDHPVIVFNPPPSAIDETPSGIEIAFWDETDELTGFRQKRRYRVNGVELPSVTTIVKVLGDADPLIHWAVSLANQGLDWRAERDRAGERGRAGHDLLLRTMLRERTSLADLDDDFRAWGQGAFRWLSARRPQVFEGERMVASVDHGFSGRFDLYAGLRGWPGIPLIDFKTVTEWKYEKGARRKPYAENVAQLDLYQAARIESGYAPADYGLIVRFGPDGTFDETPVRLDPQRGLDALAAFNAKKSANRTLGEWGGPEDVGAWLAEQELVAA
jgi:hypothetical protein